MLSLPIYPEAPNQDGVLWYILEKFDSVHRTQGEFFSKHLEIKPEFDFFKELNIWDQTSTGLLQNFLILHLNRTRFQCNYKILAKLANMYI